MKLAGHLKRSRHGVWHFRLVIPKPLRALYNGQGEVSRSLGTKDPAAARIAAYALSAQYLQVFRHVVTARGEFLGKRRAYPHEIPPQLIGRIGADGRVLPAPELIVDDPKLMSDEPGLSALPALHDYKILPLPNGRPYLAEAADEADYLRGQKALSDALEASQLPPIEQLAAASEFVRSNLGGIKLGKAISEYLGALTKTTPKNTRDEKTKTLLDFKDWIAIDPPIDLIARPKCKGYMQFLSDFQPKKTQSQEEKESEEKKSKLDPSTVKKRMSIISAFFTYAYDSNGISQANPAKGLKPFVSKRQETEHQKANSYTPFTSDELERIFNPETYFKINRIEDTLPDRFWMPILALTTGARAEELAQLRQKDLGIDALTGIWFCSITTDFSEEVDERTRAKSMSSIRRIPLHPILFELGFGEYLDLVKRQWPGRRLFPYLVNSKNGFKKEPCRNFTLYLKELGIWKFKKKVFHSFRSTLNQLADDADVPEELRTKFLGQSWDTVNSSHYGKDPEVAQFKRNLLDKVSFPCLENNVSLLKRKPTDYKYLQAKMRRKNSD